jgi:integrase
MRDTVMTGWYSRDEAMAAAAHLVNKGLPAYAPLGVHRVRTIGDLLSAWHGYQQARIVPDGGGVGGIKPSTGKFYEKAAGHLLAWLGDLSVYELSEDDVRGYLIARKKEGASPRLLLGELRAFRQAWKWGLKRELIPTRPFPDVDFKPDQTVFVINHRTPTRGDVAAVLKHMDGDYRLGVLLLYAMGARIGEVCNLRRKEVEASGLVTLRGKTGSRRVPLRPKVLAEVEDHLDGSDDYLLDYPAKDRKQALRYKLKSACKAAGIAPFTPHGLRRLAVDTLARSGVDAGTAASLTGHSPVVMLRFYRQVSDEDRARAVEVSGLGDLPAGELIEGHWNDDEPCQNGHKDRAQQH